MQCFKCGHQNPGQTAFCLDCGNQLLGEKIDYNDTNKKYFVQTITLFLCIALIIVIAHVSELNLIVHDMVFGSLLLLCTIVFASMDISGFIKIFRFSFRAKPFFLILLLAPVFAFVVIQTNTYLCRWLNLENESYYLGYQLYTDNVYLYGLLFVSVMPGFLEEFLFRGILFNHLLRLTSPKATILITGILFAFIHFAFISIIWLLVGGLVFGYLRYRYRTIWYGIFLHTLYNGSVFMIEILQDRYF